MVPLARQAGTTARRRVAGRAPGDGAPVTGAPPGTPVSMMTDFELDHEIRGGSEDAVAELAERRQARSRIRGIDPQAKLIAHYCGAVGPP
jgi:hypothetical protein